MEKFVKKIVNLNSWWHHCKPRIGAEKRICCGCVEIRELNDTQKLTSQVLDGRMRDIFLTWPWFFLSIDESPERHKLKYNGGFSNLKTLLHIKNIMDVVQILQRLRLRLHKTRSVWNRYEIGTDKPCVYMGPARSAPERLTVSNGSAGESDPVWNCTVPGWYRAREDPTQFRGTRARVDPIQMEPNRTDLV